MVVYNTSVECNNIIVFYILEQYTIVFYILEHYICNSILLINLFFRKTQESTFFKSVTITIHIGEVTLPHIQIRVV